MDPKFTKFTEFTRNSPVDIRQIAEVEAHIGKRLPVQYRHFMSEQNGGEGFIGQQYLILWRASELVEYNSEYEVEKYAPGLLLFGSNGGGEAFAFDMRGESLKIVMVPFIGMNLSDAMPVANSFEEFLTNIADGNIT